MPNRRATDGTRAATARAMTEKQFQAQIAGLAAILGWTTYHTWLSIRSKSGFPDLVLVRERIIFAELKSDKGKVSIDQENWLQLLQYAGGEAYVWRPSDFDQIFKTLQARRVPAFPKTGILDVDKPKQVD